MPKKIFKIPSFSKGVISNASPRDIPDDALAYSENVDSTTPGIIQGVKRNTNRNINFDCRTLVSLTGDEDVLIGQQSSKQFKKYNVTTATNESIGSPSSDYAYQLAPYAKSVYASMTSGLRSGTIKPAKWVGPINHVQFYNQFALADITTAINSSQTSFDVDQLDDLAVGDYVITEDGTEIMHITNISGLTITVQRGQLWTTGVSHASGIHISPVLVPSDDYVVADAEAKSYYEDDIINITNVTFSNTSSSVPILASKHYFYAFSFVYDGFQESPLIRAGGNYSPNADATYATVEFTVRFNSFNPRITGINMYRAESASVVAEYDSYRLVESYSLTKDGYQSPSGWNKASAAGYTYAFNSTFTDNGEVGATYSNNSGLPETLERAYVDYRLLTEFGGYMFYADCQVEGVDQAERFLYRSLAGSPSVVDWTNDFLVLPEKPTAMIGYAGRLFVFSEKNMYRINPYLMTIEDTFSGVGALNKDCVLSTNYGMFHADNDNIYVNNGRTSQPIATPIQTVQFGSNTYGWKEILKTGNGNYASLAFDYNDMLLLAFGNVDATTDICWSYNLQYEQWHLLTYFEMPVASANSKDGTLFFTADDGAGIDLFTAFTNPLRQIWKIITKDFDLGSDTGYFWIYEIKGYSKNDGLYTIKYYPNGDTTYSNPSITQLTGDGITVATVPQNSRKVRSVAVEVRALDVDDTLDNLVIQYRPPVIQE